MLKLSWLISIGISFIGFLIVGSLYKADYAGFIGILFVLPFLLLSLFITFRYFLQLSRLTQDHLMKILSIVGGFVLIGVFIYFAIDFKNDVLGDSFSTLPKLDQDTYSVYINFYTFALIHSISGVIGGIVGVISPKEPDPKE